MPDDPSKCWLFVSDVAKTWAGASQTCSQLGGHLAIVTDDSLRESLARELTENAASATKWWIGLRNTPMDDWYHIDESSVGELVLCFRLWSPRDM